MIEKDVTYFGTLLSISAEDVGKAVEDGSLGERVTALGLMGKDQLETLKTNLTKDVEEKHITKLVEDAKKGDLQSDLYKVVQGATYEMLEKDLSKEYGVTEYDGVKDLVSKVIKNKTTEPDDKKFQALTVEHGKLVERNKELVTEKDEAVLAAKNDYEGKLLSREKKETAGLVLFDYSDVEEKDLEETMKSRQGTVLTVFNARHETAFDENQVVVKKDGEIMKDPNTLQPVPVLDVMNSIASELSMKLKSPETGGQGGKSSGTKPGKFATQEEFQTAMAKRGIQLTSAEGIKAFNESGLMDNLK